MEKKYVKLKENKCESHLRKHFQLGTKVIVVDGSYMYKSNMENAHGYMFSKRYDSEYELLEIIAINQSFPTRYDKLHNDVLGHINNCAIKGNDGEVYFCSQINMVRYEE